MIKITDEQNASPPPPKTAGHGVRPKKRKMLKDKMIMSQNRKSEYDVNGSNNLITGRDSTQNEYINEVIEEHFDDTKYCI